MRSYRFTHEGAENHLRNDSVLEMILGRGDEGDAVRLRRILAAGLIDGNASYRAGYSMVPG